MSRTKVVISVSGGNVSGVFTNGADVEVYLVDYDNLGVERTEDCSRPFPTGRMEEFRDVVRTDLGSFPCIAKLFAEPNN